jgi:hypothetical protein
MSKELKVADGFRTNSLSLSPGGYEVSVHKFDGKVYVYDKIKSPRSYVSNMNLAGVNEIFVDGKLYWKS